MKLFFANIAFTVTADELRKMAEQFGQLDRCALILDAFTQQSRGFAFVDYTHTRDGMNALQQLHGTEWHGRRLVVREAVAKPQRMTYE